MQTWNLDTPPSTNSDKYNMNTVLSAYASRIAETTESSASIELLSIKRPQHFFELCKFHLSLLVDLPVDFSFAPQNLTESEVSTNALFRKGRPWNRFGSINDHEIDGSSGSTEESIVHTNVLKLIDYLLTGENLKVEGIFRKTGNVLRQRDLRRRILTGSELEFPLLKAGAGRRKNRVAPKRPDGDSDALSQELNLPTFNTHDYATTLKNVLHDMREPILTKELLPIFITVSGLTLGNVDDAGERVPLSPLDYQVAVAKQLKAIRLLRFLLPMRNQQLLRRFLDLLSKTLEFSQFNRMSAESLGTLFGPLLLAPMGMSAAELHRQYASLSRLATLMIEQGSSGVFSIPTTLAEDVDRNLAAGKSSQLSTRSMSSDSGVDCISVNSEELQNVAPSSPPVLYTGVVFAHRSSPQKIRTPSTNLSDTELAVAQLCATVQALPDSDPRKTRLVQRINNSNGGLVPGLQIEYKRLRDAILSPSGTPFRRNRNTTSTKSNSVTESSTKSSIRRKMPEKIVVSSKRVCTDTKFVGASQIDSATASATSLDCHCAPFCVPIINAIASPFRRPKNTSSTNSDRKRKDTTHFDDVLSFDDDVVMNSSPIFSGIFNPSHLNMSVDLEGLEQIELPETTMMEILGRQIKRRSSCLFNLRVRRNYISPRSDLSMASGQEIKTDIVLPRPASSLSRSSL